jgi:hypothetical protein
LAPSSIPELALHEQVVMNFLQSLGQVQHNLVPLEPEFRQLLVAVRSLALGSLVKLSDPFFGSTIAHQISVRAAESMINTLVQLSADDYGTLTTES